MKLYTEEQVRKAIKLSLINAKLFIHKWLGKDDKYFPTVDEGINTITPIELPSDEEIEKEVEYIAHNYFDMHNSNHFQGLKEGAEKMAKWMRDKIQNR